MKMYAIVAIMGAVAFGLIWIASRISKVGDQT